MPDTVLCVGTEATAVVNETGPQFSMEFTVRRNKRTQCPELRRNKQGDQKESELGEGDYFTKRDLGEFLQGVI